VDFECNGASSCTSRCDASTTFDFECDHATCCDPGTCRQ
jgi:hypothetical protein